MSDLIQLQKIGSDKQLLYVDSDKKLQRSFGVYLNKTFQKVHQAYDLKQGIELFKRYKPQVVIVELDFEQPSALELLDDIKNSSSKTIIITLSEQNETYELLQHLDMGISQMLLKPITFAKLASILTKLVPITVVKKKPPVAPKPNPPKPKVQAVQQPKELPKLKEDQKQQSLQKSESQPQVEPKVQEKVDMKSSKKTVTQVSQTPPKTQKELCLELIEKLEKKKELVEVLNNYKGIMIRNYANIVRSNSEYFVIQAAPTQIIAAKFEKFVVLKTEQNQYIHATLKQLDIKSGSLILSNPYFLEYKQRDINYNRFKTDSSCKASVYLEKHRVDFVVDYLSFRSAELITTNTNLPFHVEDYFDLTLGFDLGGPNKMIQEKKFTKVFAKCEVIRIDHSSTNLKVVVLMQVNKADERTLLRYLHQREEEITQEFKSIIRR
jgi:DNA-binding response OmpR family regulator